MVHAEDIGRHVPISFVVYLKPPFDQIDTFIESVKQSVDRSFEITFVTDVQKQEVGLSLLEKGYQVLVNSTDLGQAASFNQGVALSQGDPIVFLTSDILLDSLLVEPLKYLLVPEIGAATIPVRGNSEVKKKELVGTQLSANFLDGCFMISRRAFDLIGFFKEDGAFPGWERVDYTARLNAALLTNHSFPELYTEKAKSASKVEVDSFEVEKTFGELLVEYSQGEKPFYHDRNYHRNHAFREPLGFISICLPVAGSLADLKKSFKELKKATPLLKEVDHEFIFVAERPKKLVRDWLLKQKAAVVFNPTSLSSASVKNQCLALAQGDPIVLLDAGLGLPEGWLERALEILALPRLGITGVPSGEENYELVKMGGVEVGIKKGAVSSCRVIPRRSVEIIGYFNEGSQFWGNEDLDYGIRLMLAGFLTTYVPRLKATRLGKAELSQESSKSLTADELTQKVQEYIDKKLPIKVERTQYRF